MYHAKRKQFVRTGPVGMTRGSRPFKLSQARRDGPRSRRAPHLRTHPQAREILPRVSRLKRGHLETSIIEIPALDAFAAEAEERGKVEAHELDALVLEHELDEDALTAFKALLTGRGVELPAAEDDDDFELDLTPGSGPSTTDSLRHVPVRDRPLPAAHRRRRDRAREARRARRPVARRSG